MAGYGLPGRERAQQVPQERQVEVMQGPPDREIVQLARGQRIKIVGLAHALHPTGHGMGVLPRGRSRAASARAAWPAMCVSDSNLRAASSTLIPAVCTPMAQASLVTRTRASSQTPLANLGSPPQKPSST